MELGNGLYNSTFTAPTVPTQTVVNITATASKTNYALPNSYVAQITVLPLPSLEVAVTATPSTIDAGKQANVQAHVAYPGGNPVSGATVTFTSSNGGQFTTAKDIGNGFYNTTFTSPTLNSQTAITITATASKTGYTATNGTTQITIQPLPPLAVVVTPKTNTIIVGEQMNVVAYVTFPGGAPAKGVTVKFACNKGGTFSTVKDLGNGYYNTTFTAPNLADNMTVEITATASKLEYSTSTGTAQVTVLPYGSVPSGTLALCIKDPDNGTPIGGANVTSTSQPTGMNKLSGTTNGTGHIVFPNAKEGNYTLNVIKDGYNPITQTVNFKSNSTAVRTLFMTTTASTQPPQDLTAVWLALVAVIVVCIVVAAAYIQKRKTASKFKVPKKWEPPAPPKPRA
jgi:Carboxypeptidase regulatory-like domain